MKVTGGLRLGLHTDTHKNTMNGHYEPGSLNDRDVIFSVKTNQDWYFIPYLALGFLKSMLDCLEQGDTQYLYTWFE